MTDMAIGLIVIGFVVLLVVVVAAQAVKVIPAVHVAIIERFGRYHRTAQPGITFIIPVVDKKLPNTFVGEQEVSLEPEPVITSDNMVIQVSMVIYHRIIDARAAQYEVENLSLAMEKAARTSLRDLVGNLPLDQALNSEAELNQGIRFSLDDEVRKWGVSITRVEVQEMNQPGYTY